MPLARVRSVSVSSASAAASGSPTAGGCLDQLGQRPAEETEILVLAGALGGRERGIIAAQAVVQHRGRVLGEAERASLAAGGDVLDARFDQLQRLGLLAPPGERAPGRYT